MQMEKSGVCGKKLNLSRLVGEVKWFEPMLGYGFIVRSDTHEDVYVNKSGISKSIKESGFATLMKGELVEFDLVPGKKLPVAVNVSGPGGKALTCLSVGRFARGNRRTIIRSSAFNENPPQNKPRNKQSEDGMVPTRSLSYGCPQFIVPPPWPPSNQQTTRSAAFRGRRNFSENASMVRSTTRYYPPFYGRGFRLRRGPFQFGRGGCVGCYDYDDGYFNYPRGMQRGRRSGARGYRGGRGNRGRGGGSRSRNIAENSKAQQSTAIATNDSKPNSESAKDVCVTFSFSTGTSLLNVESSTDQSHKEISESLGLDVKTRGQRKVFRRVKSERGKLAASLDSSDSSPNIRDGNDVRKRNLLLMLKKSMVKDSKDNRILGRRLSKIPYNNIIADTCIKKVAKQITCSSPSSSASQHNSTSDESATKTSIGSGSASLNSSCTENAALSTVDASLDSSSDKVTESSPVGDGNLGDEQISEKEIDELIGLLHEINPPDNLSETSAVESVNEGDTGVGEESEKEKIDGLIELLCDINPPESTSEASALDSSFYTSDESILSVESKVRCTERYAQFIHTGTGEDSKVKPATKGAGAVSVDHIAADVERNDDEDPKFPKRKEEVIGVGGSPAVEAECARYY